MANKPRMGSDPFQKKDPLGWIGGDSPVKAGEQEGPESQPSNPEKPGKPGKSSTQGPPSKVGNPSKHELPSPPSSPDNPSTRSRGATTSKGLRPGWTRATFIVRDETVQQLKAVAYWDRKELKRVVEEAFSSYLEGRNIAQVPSDSCP